MADGGGGAKKCTRCTRPRAIAAYQKMGHFPDGTVLVKEVFGTTTAMTTGTVSHPEALKGWFVMVRDAKTSHPGNPLWGDGWGWSWFDAGKSLRTTPTDYKSDSQGLQHAGEVDGLDLRQWVSGRSTRRLTHGGRVV